MSSDWWYPVYKRQSGSSHRKARYMDIVLGRDREFAGVLIPYQPAPRSSEFVSQGYDAILTLFRHGGQLEIFLVLVDLVTLEPSVGKVVLGIKQATHGKIFRQWPWVLIFLPKLELVLHLIPRLARGQQRVEHKTGKLPGVFFFQVGNGCRVSCHVIHEYHYGMHEG